MMKFLTIVIVLTTSSHSVAQQSPKAEETLALEKCETDDLFKCIGDPVKFPWPPGPGGPEISSERFDPNLMVLEKLDDQFKSLKEKFGKEPTS